MLCTVAHVDIVLVGDAIHLLGNVNAFKMIKKTALAMGTNPAQRAYSI